MKNATSGFIIAAAVYGVWLLFKIMAMLAFVFMPIILIAGALYFIGYYAPKGLHDDVQAWLRERFDWLDFNAPKWSWGAIKMARGGLNWLGIKVHG